MSRSPLRPWQVVLVWMLRTLAGTEKEQEKEQEQEPCSLPVMGPGPWTSWPQPSMLAAGTRPPLAWSSLNLSLVSLAQSYSCLMRAQTLILANL